MLCVYYVHGHGSPVQQPQECLNGGCGSAVRSVQERAYLMIGTHGAVAIQRQNQERPLAGFSGRGLPQHTQQ